MRLPLIILFLAALCTGTLGNSQVIAHPLKENPFKKKKSDTAIKPFVFPKSMLVVQACGSLTCLAHNPTLNPPLYIYDHYSSPSMPSKGHNLHPRYHKDLVGVSPEQLSRIFNDKTWVKRILLKIDPTRIAPVALGQNWKAPFGGFIYFAVRSSGSNPKGSYNYFIYERERHDFREDLILFFKTTFNHRDPNANILIEGRIYLAHQKKILVIPSNRQNVPFKHASIESDGKEPKEKINVAPHILANMGIFIKEAYIKGLRQLAKDARKVIHSYKYEKRRSNY